jgi:hypothetical protein
MLKARIVILLILVAITSSAFAQKVFTLNPHETKSLTNYALWTLNAKCSIKGTQASNKILVSVLDNKCMVNGRSLSKGQATSVTVKNHENISVSAEAGASVNLVNLGSDSVEAVCA